MTVLLDLPNEILDRIAHRVISEADTLKEETSTALCLKNVHRRLAAAADSVVFSFMHRRIRLHDFGNGDGLVYRLFCTPVAHNVRRMSLHYRVRWAAPGERELLLQHVRHTARLLAGTERDAKDTANTTVEDNSAVAISSVPLQLPRLVALWVTDVSMALLVPYLAVLAPTLREVRIIHSLVAEFGDNRYTSKEMGSPEMKAFETWNSKAVADLPPVHLHLLRVSCFGTPWLLTFFDTWNVTVEHISLFDCHGDWSGAGDAHFRTLSALGDRSASFKRIWMHECASGQRLSRVLRDLLPQRQQWVERLSAHWAGRGIEIVCRRVRPGWIWAEDWQEVPAPAKKRKNRPDWIEMYTEEVKIII